MEALLALIGLVGGFLLSLILWWVLAHVVVPKLSFSSGVSKLRGRDDDKVVYRVKLENTGRRDIIDIALRARVYLPGVNLLRPTVRGTTMIIDVPLDVEHLFVLAPKRNRIVWLELHRVVDVFEPYFSAELAALLRGERDGALEALMRLSDRGYLLVQALAFDAVSGARKYFASERYGEDAIMRGTFKKLELVPGDGTAPQRDQNASDLALATTVAADRRFEVARLDHGRPHLALAPTSTHYTSTRTALHAAAGRAVAGSLELTSAATARAAVDDLMVEPGGHLATVDVESARLLADWFVFAYSVLEELLAEVEPADGATPIRMWPEHFDLMVEFGDASSGMRAAYGGSPGDALHSEPYLSVAPWQPPPAGPFWRAEGFLGAQLGYAEIRGAGDPRARALDFFRAARRALG